MISSHIRYLHLERPCPVRVGLRRQPQRISGGLHNDIRNHAMAWYVCVSIRGWRVSSPARLRHDSLYFDRWLAFRAGDTHSSDIHLYYVNNHVRSGYMYVNKRGKVVHLFRHFIWVWLIIPFGTAFIHVLWWCMRHTETVGIISNTLRQHYIKHTDTDSIWKTQWDRDSIISVTLRVSIPVTLRQTILYQPHWDCQ